MDQDTRRHGEAAAIDPAPRVSGRLPSSRRSTCLKCTRKLCDRHQKTFCSLRCANRFNGAKVAKLDAATLRYLYSVKQMSQLEIARRLRRSTASIFKALVRFGIPKRGMSVALRLSAQQRRDSLESADVQ